VFWHKSCIEEFEDIFLTVQQEYLMAKTVADVMKMVKESEVKFVDFRFTDTRGKEQHVTVPVSHFDEDKFVSGHAFDGSSVAGWKGIEASDMQLMPDPNTANIDPFFEETTLFLQCDVVEPSDGKSYDRDPRSIAKRAEAYLKASGLGDTAYFGPEPEFFIFERPGTAVPSSKAATADTVPRSRVVISPCLPSIARKTCALRCP
jgi:glutamine synthetase